MTGSTNPLLRFLASLAAIYRGFRAVVLNLLFLFLVLLIFSSLIGQAPLVVPPGAALVLDPAGVIVEQASYINPADRLINEAAGTGLAGEVLLQDLLDVIEHAGRDERIVAIVLDTDRLAGAGLSHLQDIGAALQGFRASGKRIYAVGGNYSQGQYYLAAQADEIMLNAYGGVGLEGFSAWQNYFGAALEKLGVNMHVFKVGTYKSGPEPFERSDMSPEARENYTQLLTDLWSIYVDEISTRRNLDTGQLEDLINRLDEHLAGVGGDLARLALEQGLVDRVETRAASRAYLESVLGTTDENSYPAVNWRPYLRSQQGPSLPARDTEQVGLIVARGDIGDGEAPRGSIGGDTLAGLIRRANSDEDIKALVLRVDSGGGSAFASEVIRAELAAFRASGRPVVVSMGSVAASGGYWIATPADEIWAGPATITGSIGIYGLYPTFEDSFAKLGIGTDGVGTTALAGYATVGRGLSPLAERSLQLEVEHGYRRFLDLVAASRGMSVEATDNVAQGQVWSGQRALELGLVDALGTRADAMAAAARLAGLETYTERLLDIPLSPAEQLLQQLTENVLLAPLLRPFAIRQGGSPVSRLVAAFERELGTLLKLNDPNALYLHCLQCRSLAW